MLLLRRLNQSQRCSLSSERRKAERHPVDAREVTHATDGVTLPQVNMAYMFIAASVVQMTRGAIVIFTCLFSVVFLGKRQHRCSKSKPTCQLGDCSFWGDGTAREEG